MPRKRKTRTTQSRTKPKVPEGDDGIYLDKDIKAEKLKTLLADFDTEMSSFFDSIQEQMKDYEKNIQCSYRMCVAKIPKYVREMDLEDFLKAGGKLTTEVITEQVEMSLGTDLPLASIGKSKKKNKRKGKTSSSQDETGSIRRPAPRRKRTALGKSTIGNMPPPSTMKTVRSTRQRGQFETPFQRGDAGTAGWDTPLITPKFDPRLPVTPTMTRRPRTGEVVLSLAGSPISNCGDGSRGTILLKKDDKSRKPKLIVENMEFDLDNLQIPDYEQTTKDYLRMLKEKLNAITLSPAHTT